MKKFRYFLFTEKQIYLHIVSSIIILFQQIQFTSFYSMRKHFFRYIYIFECELFSEWGEKWGKLCIRKIFMEKQQENIYF